MSLRSNLRALLTLGRGVVKGISELTATDDPLSLCRDWIDDARRAGIFLPERVNLATATKDGIPSARMMLHKGLDDRGFLFYTNYESRKGRELEENPHAALTFHWSVLERQIRVEGTAEKLSSAESEAYFSSRPRGSRIGAWASDQSRAVESREQLAQRFREYDKKYPGENVPLPPFWGGWRLRPTSIEFWQGRLNRLHDRLRYDRKGDGWEITRLNP